MMFIELSCIAILFATSALAEVEAPFIEGSDQEISVMSFNIRYDEYKDGENWWENRREACVSMIQELSPSVIGMQEVLANQLSFLETELEDYSSVGVGRDDGDTLGEYAPVLYRHDLYELLDDGHFWLSETPDQPSYGWDAACRRIVTWVHLQDAGSGKDLFVFNAHFDHKGKLAREESAKLLVKQISKITDTTSVVFITGDFNMLLSNSNLNPILDKFYESRSTAGSSESGPTLNSWGKHAGREIDFIFYREANALKFEVIDEDYGVPYISDHYPIMTDFSF